MAQDVGGRKGTKVMHFEEMKMVQDEADGGLALFIDMALGTNRTNKRAKRGSIHIGYPRSVKFVLELSH